jgi:hypothetical protein
MRAAQVVAAAAMQDELDPTLVFLDPLVNLIDMGGTGWVDDNLHHVVLLHDLMFLIACMKFIFSANCNSSQTQRIVKTPNCNSASALGSPAPAPAFASPSSRNRATFA